MVDPLRDIYSGEEMSTVRWVVAGIGDIARKRVIPAIQSEPRSVLLGFVTRDQAKAAAYPGARSWPTIEDAVADPGVDAAYIALPVALHAGAAIAALRAGKHVLCEKPMAMNFAEAERMVDEGRASGCVFGVSYYRRLYPKLVRAKQLIAEGAIGRPLLAEANCHGWLEIEGREWLADPTLSGGGPLYDIASHRIDVLNFLFGQPSRACGHLSNAVHQYGVEDNATVVIDYVDGMRGIVDVRWHSKVRRDECRIRGTDGEMDLTPLNGPELIYPGGRENIPNHANVHGPMIENFVDAVLGKAPLLASGASAYWTDWVIEQSRRSGVE